MTKHDPNKKGDPVRKRQTFADIGFIINVVSCFWVPALFVDYSAGFTWTLDMSLALITLVSLGVLGVVLGRKASHPAFLIATGLLVVTTFLTAFSFAVVAAFVHTTPPSVVIGSGFMALVLPFCATERYRPMLLVVCVVCFSATTSFWMLVFHPYL